MDLKANNAGTSKTDLNIVQGLIGTNLGGSYDTKMIDQPRPEIQQESSASQEPYQQPILEPIITKDFYIHKAPVESADAAVSRQITVGRPEKHYRIVFITAPEYTNSAAQLSAEIAQKEEKTIIYVLSKKPDGLDLGDIAIPAPTKASKPEVYFIKYKTQEEAEHAQKEIQGNSLSF